jgi:hypothetical protein
MDKLASAMEITKYPNSPLIKSESNKRVLVASDGEIEYILGYVTKGDSTSSILVYSQFFSGSFGQELNDLYNNVQNVDDLSSTLSKKKRVLLVGQNKFIGSAFHDGNEDSNRYGFGNKNFWKNPNYLRIASNPEAPVAPLITDEANFISMEGGNKVYQSSSGSLEEFNAMRINIGLSGTDIHSYGDWTPSTLRVETPVERLVRSISENDASYASGARTGFPDASTFHIYNFVDNSSFFMGKSIIEIEKSNANNTVFAKTVYDADGVLIEVDSGSRVNLTVNTASFVIDQNNVHITGATLNYHGDLYVDGDLIVSGSSTLITDVDMVGGNVIVNTSGKLLTIGGSDLA